MDPQNKISHNSSELDNTMNIIMHIKYYRVLSKAENSSY